MTERKRTRQMPEGPTAGSSRRRTRAALEETKETKAARPARWTCGKAEVCEADEQGRYAALDECRTACAAAAQLWASEAEAKEAAAHGDTHLLEEALDEIVDLEERGQIAGEYVARGPAPEGVIAWNQLWWQLLQAAMAEPDNVASVQAVLREMEQYGNADAWDFWGPDSAVLDRLVDYAVANESKPLLRKLRELSAAQLGSRANWSKLVLEAIWSALAQPQSPAHRQWLRQRRNRHLRRVPLAWALREVGRVHDRRALLQLLQGLPAGLPAAEPRPAAFQVLWDRLQLRPLARTLALLPAAFWRAHGMSEDELAELIRRADERELELPGWLGERQGGVPALPPAAPPAPFPATSKSSFS